MVSFQCEGALYKDNTNKNKKARFNPPNSAEEESNHLFHTPTPAVPIAPIKGSNNQNNNTKNNKQQVASTPSAKKSNMAAVAQYQTNHHMSHAAYVEDVPDELEAYLVADDDDSRSDDNAPPHAPTPPPVSEAEAGGVNVFDFLVAGATPNASSLGLPQTDVARYEHDANAYLNATDDFSMAGHAKYQQHLAQFGTGPVPTSTSTALAPFQTPAPGDRAERKKKESSDKDKDAKKDKKRKRLYLDINDQVMTDAPPVLHSGLTGGLKSLTTKHTAFPPSPESAETPASPLKKSKHSKHKSSKSEPITNSLFSMLTSKPKTKKRKHRRSTSPSGKKHSNRKHRRDSEKSDKAAGEPQKLLEYPGTEKKEGEDSNAGQLVIYKPRADLFLSFVNKGPDSERGCSMNKALKRFHRERERSSAGTALAKPLEEKELFRSLRLRKNDRGEIVLFCVDDE
ncbi:hypothetical protein SEUCBS139899_003753 [Sporothrix eucalyptigena]